MAKNIKEAAGFINASVEVDAKGRFLLIEDAQENTASGMMPLGLLILPYSPMIAVKLCGIM